MTTEPTFGSPPGGDGPDAAVDSTLDVLGSRHRRHVLSALVGGSPPVALDDLASAVAERESVASTDGSDGVRTSLHHVHLPKLADAGLVAYDAEAGVVAATPRLRAMATHLADGAE